MLRITTDAVYLGDEKVNPYDVVSILEDAEIPRDRAIHIRLERDLKNLSAPQALRMILAKGGYTRSVFVTRQHGEGESAFARKNDTSGLKAQDDFVMFTISREGVRYGWMASVGPDDVVKILEDDRVGRDRPIRLCGQERDFKSSEVRDVMKRLEDILRKAGYVNVQRFWILPPKDAASVVPVKNGIRYKRSDEGR